MPYCENGHLRNGCPRGSVTGRQPLEVTLSYTVIFVDDPTPYVRRITLNRPEKRNALNSALRGEIIDCLRRNDEDPGVRVTIIRGGGTCFRTVSASNFLKAIREQSLNKALTACDEKFGDYRTAGAPGSA